VIRGIRVVDGSPTEELGVHWMPCAANPRRRREDVVDPSIGPEELGRPGIAVGPSVARCETGHFPGVVEGLTRNGRGHAACQHTNLVAVGIGVEVAAEHERSPVLELVDAAK
jgi:hypothetical protein